MWLRSRRRGDDAVGSKEEGNNGLCVGPGASEGTAKSASFLIVYEDSRSGLWVFLQRTRST